MGKMDNLFADLGS